MYISEIRVKNYLVHADTSVDLLPLVVLVGPNGGGKSALFDAMLNFSMLARGSLRQAFGPYPFSFHGTLHRGASSVARIGYRMTFKRRREDEEALYYEIDYSQTGQADSPSAFTIHKERLIKQPEEEMLFERSEPDASLLGRTLPLEADRSVFAAMRRAQITGSKPDVDELLSYCTQQISRFNKFRLDPYVLSQASRLPDVSDESELHSRLPRLGYHGEDLAATLYYLSETEHPAIEAIRGKLKEFDDTIDGFDFTMLGTDRVGFSVVYSDCRGTVPAVRLSAGVLILIGLLVLVLSPNRPSIMMVEEPENGLTPQAVKLFYGEVRDLALSENPESRSQVLISSHSPFVICEAWNGEDRDFIFQAKVEQGKALVRSFSDVISEHSIQLSKESGERKHLGLRTAELVMSGYMS